MSEQPTEQVPQSWPQPWSGADVLIISAAVIVAGALGVLVTRADTSGLATALTIGAKPWLAPVTLALAVQGVLIPASVVLLGAARRGLSLRDIGLTGTTIMWVLAGIGLALVLLPVRVGLGLAVQTLVNPSAQDLEQASGVLIPDVSLIGALLIIVLGGVLVPIGEELFFRGVLYRWLREKLGEWPGILISAAIFGAAHLSLATGVAAFVLGVVLAWAFSRSKSLWASITIHVANNTFVFALAFAAMALSRLVGTQ